MEPHHNDGVVVVVVIVVVVVVFVNIHLFSFSSSTLVTSDDIYAKMYTLCSLVSTNLFCKCPFF